MPVQEKYLAEALRKDAPYNLSDRELDVAELIISSDRTNQEIADILFISKFTVETHMQNIRKKTGAKRKYGITMKLRQAIRLTEWK